MTVSCLFLGAGDVTCSESDGLAAPSYLSLPVGALPRRSNLQSRHNLSHLSLVTRDGVNYHKAIAELELAMAI